MNRPMRMALWVLAGAGLLIGGCAGPSGRDEELVSGDVLASTGTSIFWEASLPLDEKADETVRDIYREAGRIYAQTSENRMLALDAHSGHFLWAVNLGEKGQWPTPVGQHGGMVYVGVLHRLMGFSIEDGLKVYEREVEHAPSTRPVPCGEYVCFGSHQGWFRAVNVADNSLSWDRLTHSDIVADPVCAAGMVLFANLDGRVFASKDNMRSIVWEFPAREAVTADLARSTSGLVLVASRDYTLYALNPRGGEVAWQVDSGDPMTHKPWSVGERVYCLKEDGELLAVDETSGETVWTAPGIQRVVAISPVSILALSRDVDRIVALSPEDGTVKWALHPDRLQLFARNEIDGQIFAATADGRVACLREDKVEYSEAAGD